MNIITVSQLIHFKVQVGYRHLIISEDNIHYFNNKNKTYITLDSNKEKFEKLRDKYRIDLIEIHQDYKRRY